MVPKASGVEASAQRKCLERFRQKDEIQDGNHQLSSRFNSVLASICQGDWMISLDVQDAYFHILVHPDSRKYLRFIFEDQIFQFRALCFGLLTAPQVFT